MFNLDLENERIIFKLRCKEHFEIQLPKMRKNWKKKLLDLQERTKEGLQPYSVKIDENFIYISFEEPLKQEVPLLDTRYVGIDLNPNSIGVSVLENGKILEVKQFEFQELTREIFTCKQASNHKRSKHLQNKLNYEIIQVSKFIEKLVQHYKCKFVFLEDLNFKQQDSGLGKRFNRLTKNLWKRNKFSSNLKKRVESLGCKLFVVNAAYSSTIGNLMYEFSDPVNASLEIARRGYEVIILKNKKFYPELTTASLKNQWKEDLTKDVSSWKEFHKKIKNLKLMYRVPLCGVSPRVFSHFSKLSKVKHIVFT